MSELEYLRDRATELARLAHDRPEADRATRLAERLAAGRFLVAVVGEFNRGKSTLINALLGEALLPSGALPLTSIATEVTAGEPGVVVTFMDGRSERIELEQVVDYVSEASNPRNHREVDRVTIRGSWPLLEQGVVLVDTPGIASVHSHNTVVGRAALLDADGAVMVLSADSPMSEREREVIDVLAERRGPTFFVLNKADHVGDELDEVRAFVSKSIAEVFGAELPLYATDSRNALSGHRSSSSNSSREGLEFSEFASDLRRFISGDLIEARLSSARRELSRLGSSLTDAISIELSARRLTTEQVTELSRRLEHEVETQQRGFDDDRTLLATDLRSLLEGISDHILEFGRAAPARYDRRLAEIADDVPRARLREDLRREVERAVQEAFDEARSEIIGQAEDLWLRLAEELRGKVQRRVDQARQAASELFEVPLPRLTIPHLAEQSDRFSYLFVRVGGTNEPLGRVVSRLVPGRWARSRALRSAQDDLRREFDKHAGRTRWDLEQRLSAARQELELALRGELEDSIKAIAQAADRASHREARVHRMDRREEERTSELMVLGSELARLAGPT